MMRPQKILLPLFVLFSLCCPKFVWSAPFRIGVSAPLSGPVSRFGLSTINGMKLAIDEINKEGGSSIFEMVIEDDQCKPPIAVTNIRKFQDVLKLNAMVVTCSAVAPAVAPLTKDRSIVFSTSAIVSAIENKGFNHYFCLQPTIAEEVDFLLSFAKSKKIHTLGLLILQNDFMRTYQDAFEKTAKNYGIKILTVVESELANTDFRSLLVQLLKEKPDAIFAGLPPEPLLSFMRQKSNLKNNTLVLSGWPAGTADFAKTAGALANGLIFSYPYKDDKTRRSSQFRETYNKTFNEEPDAAAATAYDAVFILASNLAKCSDSNDLNCLIQQTNNLHAFDGASGNFSFKNGIVQKPIYLKSIQDGKAFFLN